MELLEKQWDVCHPRVPSTLIVRALTWDERDLRLGPWFDSCRTGTLLLFAVLWNHIKSICSYLFVDLSLGTTVGIDMSSLHSHLALPTCFYGKTTLGLSPVAAPGTSLSGMLEKWLGLPLEWLHRHISAFGGCEQVGHALVRLCWNMPKMQWRPTSKMSQIQKVLRHLNSHSDPPTKHT